MKISRDWLQKFFDAPLPDAQALADALTFHAFEIESVEHDVLDVKVTPNRGHDALCHRGIAKELSAVLNVPLKSDPLREVISLTQRTDAFKVSIENPKLCRRFTGAFIKGVKVGPSPEWLRKALESVGQKSINNVVDATNYVMFDIGQPLHAFDAGKLTDKNGKYALDVRSAKKGEKMLGLDDKEYTLTDVMLAIADGNTGEAVSIAGIKGGKPTGIDERTTDVILEAANWDGVMIRKTSQALKLRTDASDRFQQVISPEFAAYGTSAAAKLIVELAGGIIVGYVDEYPVPQVPWQVSVPTSRVNAVLGTSLSDADVADTLRRLGLPFAETKGTFVVSVPFERLDLTIPEDLIEEVARIVGYDKIPAAELPPFPRTPEINPNFYAAEKAREELMSQGFSEVYTSVFAEKGERMVANKVDGERPCLRDSLSETLTNAVKRNLFNSALFGLDTVKLFEIGTVWRNRKEETLVGIAEGKLVGGLMQVDTQEKPLREYEITNTSSNFPISETERYKPFSKFPFIVRDIALWVPEGTSPEDVLNVIRPLAGELLTRSEKFDEFKKGGKQSYAFRLVFQSFEKTLTDEEANAVMEKVYAAVKERGWEVR